MTAYRRGVSLVEVLIAMFVLSIGLLGLASLIPVGNFQLTSASNADRSSAAFRAAFRDTKVRRMLNPRMWLDNVHANVGNRLADTDPNWSGLTAQAWVDIDGGGTTLANPLALGNSLCIDPWFIMNNSQKTGVQLTRLGAFPLLIDNDPGNNPPRMIRATLRSWLSPLAPMMSEGVAERVFTWQDDVVFSLPENDEFRPQLQYDWADLAGFNQPVRRQVAGQYSWLLTVTPATSQLVPMPGGSTTPGGPPQRMAAEYTVSIVIFYRRVADADVAASFGKANREGQPPTERLVFADFPYGSGLGGGAVRLRLPDPNPVDKSDPDTSDIPRVRPNHWLMLCGWVPDASVPSIGRRAVFKWYRIAAVGDGPKYDDATEEWFQDVTLDGPDWYIDDAYTGMIPSGGSPTDTFNDADLSTPVPTVWAALFDGVIAVGQKTMPLESWNMWSP